MGHLRRDRNRQNPWRQTTLLHRRRAKNLWRSPNNKKKKRAKICYARVSSEHQQGDLERQIAHLQQCFPDHEIISDIGSGLNWKRRGFAALLERIHAEVVEEVVVTRKDRLCRFGSELVEWIFAKNETQLVVLGSDVGADGGEARELAEDLLSIVTVFVARHNGLRSAANRKRRREATLEGQDHQAVQEGQDLHEEREAPSWQGEAETEGMDENGTVNQQPMPRRSRKRKRKTV